MSATFRVSWFVNASLINLRLPQNSPGGNGSCRSQGKDFFFFFFRYLEGMSERFLFWELPWLFFSWGNLPAYNLVELCHSSCPCLPWKLQNTLRDAASASWVPTCYTCNITEVQFLLLCHAVNSCLDLRPKSSCPCGVTTWEFKRGFRNATACGQPLHRHCSVRAAEGRLRGDFVRLTNPFPCYFVTHEHSVLVLMPFTPTCSALWSTLFQFRSTQSGEKKTQRKQGSWGTSSAGSCRNRSDLTDWMGGALASTRREVPLWPGTSRSVVRGIPQSASRNITPEAVAVSLCSHSPSCEEARCCCSVTWSSKSHVFDGLHSAHCHVQW